MGRRSSSKFGKGLQAGAIMLCVAFALRGRPPAGAQTAPTGISLEDARQDDAISTLRESTDKSETRLEQRLDLAELELRGLHDDMDEGRNENRAEFGSIALLGASGMLMGRRRRKDQPE
jgi:hypothetical protein